MTSMSFGFRRIVFCGPSQARCGVCVTTALWLHGLSEIIGVDDAADLTWLTNVTPNPSRTVPVDPLAATVRRIPCHERPGEPRSDRYVHGIETVAQMQPGDLFVLDWSSGVIEPKYANVLCAKATERGAVVVVRIHSQLLQGLHPCNVGLFVAPFELADAQALHDSEVNDIDAAKWAVLPHPCAPPVWPPRDWLEPPSPEKKYAPVFSLGPRGKSAHRYVWNALKEIGGTCVTPDLDRSEWTSIADYVKHLSTAQTLVLFYLPLFGIGRSSALGMAVAARRPVVASDSVMLAEATAWDGVVLETELADALAKAGLRRGVPSHAQDEYLWKHSPSASAKALLRVAAEVRGRKT